MFLLVVEIPRALAEARALIFRDNYPLGPRLALTNCGHPLKFGARPALLAGQIFAITVKD